MVRETCPYDRYPLSWFHYTPDRPQRGQVYLILR